MVLNVYVEMNGSQHLAGRISGTSNEDAVFSYDETYLAGGGRAISQSMPVGDGTFSSERTRCFFEGLLPEGFSRKSVAGWMHADEWDYLSILTGLGKECLGAIRIDREGADVVSSAYRELSIQEVKSLAAEGATKSTELLVASHLSLTGASGKAGLYLNDENGKWYQPYGAAPSTHIVKQSHVRLSNLVENEQLVLRTASEMGLPTVESFIINTGNYTDSDILLASKRYDRDLVHSEKTIDGLRCPLRLHQEDFAQALGITSADKYEKDGQDYLADMFRLVRNVSASPLQDQLALLDLLIYDDLIGNTDNHVKNVSLIYSSDLKSASLAPAYDVLSTVVYPQSTTEMSISIAGEREWKNIDKETFARAAGQIGMNAALIRKEYDRLQKLLPHALEKAASELENEGFRSVRDIKERMAGVLTKNGKI